jgi:hypothetical protein
LHHNHEGVAVADPVASVEAGQVAALAPLFPHRAERGLTAAKDRQGGLNVRRPPMQRGDILDRKVLGGWPGWLGGQGAWPRTKAVSTSAMVDRSRSESTAMRSSA